ncbi:MAG: leucine-rich repeat domain-containing protein [Bacteroidota bacterium]
MKNEWDNNSYEFSRSGMGLTHIPQELSLKSKYPAVFLQKNRIKKIQNLDGLVSTKKLNLSNNQIKKVENLKSITSLERIYLSNNQIEEIHKDSFPAGLLRLNLSGNHIKYIEKGALPRNLEELDLRNNRLAAIPEELLELKLPFYNQPQNGKKGIYLGGNAIDESTIEKYNSRTYPEINPVDDPSESQICTRACNCKIYISYKWDKTGKHNLVDKLDRNLDSHGFRLCRDKTELMHADSVSKFMSDLGKSNLTILILSDGYFKSYFCMQELCDIARNNKWEKEKFLNAVIPITLKSIDLKKPLNYNEYSDYWKKEVDEMQSYIQENIEIVTEKMSQNLLIKRKIRERCLTLMEWLTERNYKSLEEVQHNNFEEIRKIILKRICVPNTTIT